MLLLAKLGSPEQVGLYALGMAVSAPIVLFANLQLRTLLATDVTHQFGFGQYFSFRVVTLGLALFAIAGVAVWTAPDWRHAGIILLVGFAQQLEYVSDTYYGLMQKYGRLDRMSWSLLIKGPLALGCLWAAMYFTRDVAWAIAGLALGRIVVLLGWDSRLSFRPGHGAAGREVPARLEWNPAGMTRLLRLSFPLGVISMLCALSPSLPRYFIEGHLGTTELGIFSAIASLLTAGTMVVSAFGQAIMLPAAKACAAGDRAGYRSFVLQTAALGGILGAGGILLADLFGPYLLTHIFRPEYGAHADIFVWLMAAGTILFITNGLGYVMTAARALQPQIPLFLANCATVALVAAWAVPRHGLRGGAESILAAALVQLAGSLWILRRIDRRLASAAPLLATPEPEPASLQAAL